MSNIKLPNSPHINVEIGLKYLNHNEQLYLKILNNFVTRYEAFNLDTQTEEELKSTLHTLKGLSATLGMESLSALAEALENRQSKEKLEMFNKLLNQIIKDLKV